MLTLLFLLIQLSQLRILLPLRNKTAFVTTVWSHLLTASWIAVIEQSSILVFYSVRLHSSSACVMTTERNHRQSCFSFFPGHEWTWLPAVWVSWQLPPCLFMTSFVASFLFPAHGGPGVREEVEWKAVGLFVALLLTVSSDFIDRNWAKRRAEIKKIYTILINMKLLFFTQ